MGLDDLFLQVKAWKALILVIGALLTVLLVFGHVRLLRWFDDRAGVDFRNAITAMLKDPRAIASYLGQRNLGTSIISAAAIIALALVLSSCSASAGEIPSKYDREISHAVERFWPDYPYASWWKAQLFQESRLDPSARSAVGAEGLAQFMPGTWSDVSRALGLGIVSRSMAEPAILGGAYYMAQLRRSWRTERPPDQRHLLALASYNAGFGNILGAQAECGGILWSEIAPCLADVTGERNARETIGYPIAIARWRAAIEARL